MAQCNYVLKAGVLLQAFSDASKTCTNANLTDELAQFHLKRDPSCARFFAVMPGQTGSNTVTAPRPQGPTIIIPPEKEVPKVANDFVNAVLAPPAEVVTPEVKPVQIVKKKVVATKRRK
ncbi:MAG TPA: hypothetical protein VMV77_08895 [Bacteroidales bacterium]|nr:hypothetical protein [Bacteroidales bacterium]